MGLREGAPDYARRLDTEEGEDAERDRAIQRDRDREGGREIERETERQRQRES